MLLIYTHKITPRFTYIARHICTRVLGLEVSFTTKVEDFIRHSGPKITYTKQPLQNEFFIRSNGLLFEQGINDLQINVGDWEGVPCFFHAGERSNVPYDIFSASFYMLSRYEEYLPHVKDIHGRFSPKDSLGHQNQFLERPVVDIWAYKLLEGLQDRFPGIAHGKRSYSFTSIIDVTTSHCYANRGLVRGTVGLFRDLGYFRLKKVAKRIQVLIQPKKDPFDNFDTLIELHKKYRVHSMFFFQFAKYSTYDKNVSINSNTFRFLIKSIADYGLVSLSASYSSFDNKQVLKKEKKDLQDVLNRPVNLSRIRYNRTDIPSTYRDLVETEFTDDYTMGYTHEIGFRAGTCSPFYFYDIPLEIQQPIRVHPFAVHDYALVNAKNKVEILERVQAVFNEVWAVNGAFVTIFSNELLGGVHAVDWIGLYADILKKYNV